MRSGNLIERKPKKIIKPIKKTMLKDKIKKKNSNDVNPMLTFQARDPSRKIKNKPFEKITKLNSQQIKCQIMILEKNLFI
jgi:hypothetical protein